jgi:Holliday junction resolvase RusA-like endonuclease
MTQSDRWKKRPCVMRYWAFCDQVKQNKVKLPLFDAKVIFYLPMPESWSAKKRFEYFLRPHQQRPDLSNLLKALEDACYGEDCRIWHYASIEKRWSTKGEIVIVSAGEK